MLVLEIFDLRVKEALDVLSGIIVFMEFGLIYAIFDPLIYPQLQSFLSTFFSIYATRPLTCLNSLTLKSFQIAIKKNKEPRTP